MENYSKNSEISSVGSSNSEKAIKNADEIYEEEEIR